MVKIAILHHAPKPPWSSLRLINAALEMGIDTSYIVWDYLSVRIGKEPCHVLYRGKCFPYNAVIVRGIGRGINPNQLLYRFTVLSELENDGILVVNPARSLITARNKLRSLLELEKCGIKVPRTTVTENITHALRTVREYGKAVIKPLTGSLGLGSFKVENEDTAYYVVNLLSELNEPLYIQEYLEKKDNRDIRVFVVGEKAIAAMYRYASDQQWKTNIAQGARAEPMKLTYEIEEIAIRATKCLGLYYSGVDIIEDSDGDFYVVEVNASPLWRGLQQATNIDPAKHIIREVVRLLRQ